MISAITPEEQAMEDTHIELQWYAEPLCKEVEKTKLPPFCVIHHTIPLIDKAKIYPWHPLRCLEAFQMQWAEKCDAYIKSEQWKITSAGNTVPMLLIPKPGTNPPLLQTVVGL